MEENVLFKQLKEGFEPAFDQLFRTYYAKLCRYAVMLGCTPEDAEEIVQNLFAKIWIKRDKLKVSLSVKSYLYTATRNSVLNIFEHQKVQLKHSTEQKFQHQDIYDINPMVVAELQSHIDNAIEKLSEGRKQIFLMSRNHGLSYPEIATKLNISPKTVENQMGHALKLLRKELGEYLPLIIGAGLIYFELMPWGYL